MVWAARAFVVFAETKWSRALPPVLSVSNLGSRSMERPRRNSSES